MRDRAKVTIDHYLIVVCALSIATKIIDLGLPWTAFPHSTAQIWKKVEPCYQRQKCSARTLLQATGGSCGYLRGFPRELGGGKRRFFVLSLASCLGPLEITKQTLFKNVQQRHEVCYRPSNDPKTRRDNCTSLFQNWYTCVVYSKTISVSHFIWTK